jgi:nitrile hydratase
MFASVGPISDIGGRREHFGPVEIEPEEPVFHERAEGRVLAISSFVLALCGRNIDAFRYATEQLPPDLYFSSYYRRMLAGCERLLVRAGYLGPDEVEARLEGRRAQAGRRQGSRARLAVTSWLMHSTMRPRLPPWVCAHVLPRVLGASRPTLRRGRLRVGDPVRVRPRQARGHTRQPGYVTGRRGVVVAHLGATLFPDAHAVDRPARPEHLYTVAFEGRELWGEAADPRIEVRVDLYEPYLEAA